MEAVWRKKKPSDSIAATSHVAQQAATANVKDMSECSGKRLVLSSPDARK